MYQTIHLPNLLVSCGSYHESYHIPHISILCAESCHVSYRVSYNISYSNICPYQAIIMIITSNDIISRNRSNQIDICAVANTFYTSPVASYPPKLLGPQGRKLGIPKAFQVEIAKVAYLPPNRLQSSVAYTVPGGQRRWLCWFH